MGSATLPAIPHDPSSLSRRPPRRLASAPLRASWRVAPGGSSANSLLVAVATTVRRGAFGSSTAAYALALLASRVAGRMMAAPGDPGCLRPSLPVIPLYLLLVRCVSAARVRRGSPSSPRRRPSLIHLLGSGCEVPFDSPSTIEERRPSSTEPAPGAIFWRVVLPAARPAIAVTALFAFMSAWNEFILAAALHGPGGDVHGAGGPALSSWADFRAAVGASWPPGRSSSPTWCCSSSTCRSTWWANLLTAGSVKDGAWRRRRAGGRGGRRVGVAGGAGGAGGGAPRGRRGGGRRTRAPASPLPRPRWPPPPGPAPAPPARRAARLAPAPGRARPFSRYRPRDRATSTAKGAFGAAERRPAMGSGAGAGRAAGAERTGPGPRHHPPSGRSRAPRAGRRRPAGARRPRAERRLPAGRRARSRGERMGMVKASASKLPVSFGRAALRFAPRWPRERGPSSPSPRWGGRPSWSAGMRAIRVRPQLRPVPGRSLFQREAAGRAQAVTSSEPGCGVRITAAFQVRPPAKARGGRARRRVWPSGEAGSVSR